MSLLDKIKKAAETVVEAVDEKLDDVDLNDVKKAIGDTFDEVKDIIDDNLKDVKKTTDKDHSKNVVTDKTNNNETVMAEDGDGGHTIAYFKEVLSSEFGNYEILEDVSPKELGGVGRNYDFALAKDKKIIALIPLAEHNRTNNQAWKSAKNTAEKAKIPFINFYLHMPNKRDFVIDRINRLMK